ncbi:endonuclease [Ferruginibacter sp. HRS2-29]|uniref:endonuclease n=1 Tax=Ferruginibacter sp. HRS2-29 TaxID=2487334 RepID=UPI0020CBA89E|nr:endonuclease [Ferruginibacter sp. HRS2-29]MCP9750984.1 T9SS C-terminal target domain-containing protein [Ferruginibacter sp. HRS2-29]
MLKIYTLLISAILLSHVTKAQGTESFTNAPATGSTYTAITWTGDNGLTWNAVGRTDGGGNITGFTGTHIIMRNTTGIVSCDNIPNGIGTISFKYALANTGSATFGVFINNTQYGTTVTATSNASTDYSLPINVSGTFKLEIRQLSAANTNRLGIDDISWTGNGVPCTEPTAQPEDLNLSITPTTISGDFTPVTPAADAYFVVRSLAPTLSANPVDGVSYTAGQAFGGGTVVGYVTAANFNDVNLTASTTYYYYIFAVNNDCGAGNNYVNTNPLTGVATTSPLAACTTPPSAPPSTPISNSTSNTSISVNFTPASGANSYLVVYTIGTNLNATPVNGTVYTPGQTFGNGIVASVGANTSFAVYGLTQNTIYYFYYFSANTECSGQPFYNTVPMFNADTTSNNSTGIPAGFYNSAASLSCQPLKTALKTISGNGYVNISYDGVYQAYQFTDIHRNDANTANIIWDIYSDNPTGAEAYTYTFGTNACGQYDSEGDCYNREHSTPKSWFNDASPMFSDIQHLYPTDGWVNGKRSNFPYGEVTNASFTSTNGSKLGTGNNFGYTGTVFEPINAYKGDLARTSLYMATRYEDEIISQNWSGNTEASPLFLSTSDEPDVAKRRLQIYDLWYLKLVFKWINQDPVSQKEIDRNNAIYYQSGQHNRNPYVDHPEYAALVFQCTGVVPVTITDFTAVKNNETALLKWYATYETNFRKYEVERSTDGIAFNKIGEVAGQNLANYSFTDNNLPSTASAYYRLKMIDIDGSFQYSRIAAVKLNNNLSNALVYPNPTVGNLTIKLMQTLAARSTLVVTDISGRVVMQRSVAVGDINIPLDVKGLASGRYFIKISNNSQVINESFVVIK